MLLSIKRDTLLKPLLMTTGLVEKRQTMPILSNVYLRKIGNEITVVANDMEIQASIVTSGEMQGEDFTITLPAKKLQDVLRVFPENQDIKFSEQQGSKIVISCGRTKFSLQSMDAMHYPLLKLSEDVVCQFNISQAKLKHMLSQIQYCMADKDSRGFLNGMYFEIKNDQLRLVATDAHRLTTMTATISPTSTNASAIIPRKTILELYRLLEDDEKSDMLVKIYGNQVYFETQNKQLITKVIDGKYPDYEKVIPIGNTKLCLVNRLELLECVERVCVIGIDKLKTLTFDFTKNHLTLSCKNEEQEDSIDELDVTYPDEKALNVSFNMTYLRDLLLNTANDTVQFAFLNNQKSILVTIPDNNDFKSVIMPLRN